MNASYQASLVNRHIRRFTGDYVSIILNNSSIIFMVDLPCDCASFSNSSCSCCFGLLFYNCYREPSYKHCLTDVNEFNDRLGLRTVKPVFSMST